MVCARWDLNNRDKAMVGDLITAVRKLVPLAHSGNDLAAIGEAWDSLEMVLEDPEYEFAYILNISVGFRRGDRDFSEGLFLNLRINDDGKIILDELNTSYSSDIGSNHFIVEHTFMDQTTGFDSFEFGRWLEMFEDILGEDDVRLSTSRDHL